MRINTAALAVLLCHRAWSQAVADYRTMDDTMQMRVSISYDKETYFTGEEAVVTLSVTNPLNRVAHVIEPFGPNAGRVHPLGQAKNGEWYSLLDHPGGDCRLCPNEVVTMQPNEIRTFVFRTSEGCGRGRVFIVASCPTWEQPGTYAFQYVYGSGGMRSLTVNAAPTLLEFQNIRHKRTLSVRAKGADGKATEKFIEYPREDAAFVLEWNNKRYVAITSHSRQGFSPIMAGTTLVGVSVLMVGPYRLVDESVEEIRNLRFTADDQENFALTYDRGSERAHKLQLDASRKPLGATR